MQAAVRKRGQTIGHYLIAHAGRTPWDIKTKATSETDRGVPMWMNFAYGPNWSCHEGGPAWRSHLWHAKPELWTANAEITREIGAVEEWLLTATPAPAEVALLYSSSSDIWTMQENLAYGFDRMHTWLALTHANAGRCPARTGIRSPRSVQSLLPLRSESDLLNRITQATAGKPQVTVRNIADFERRLTDYNFQEELKQELAFNADVIVIALGENASAPTTDEAKAQFASAFAKLFAELKQHGQPTLFVRSQFWQDAQKDGLMKQACENAGGLFVDISELGFDAANFARAEGKIEHAGVAGHPGDQGMLELANALWNAIQKHGKPSH